MMTYWLRWRLPPDFSSSCFVHHIVRLQGKRQADEHVQRWKLKLFQCHDRRVKHNFQLLLLRPRILGRACCSVVLLLWISSQTIMQSFVTTPISVTRYLTAVLFSLLGWHHIQVRSATRCAYLPVQYSFHFRERANITKTLITPADRYSWKLTYARQRHIVSRHREAQASFTSKKLF